MNIGKYTMNSKIESDSIIIINGVEMEHKDQVIYRVRKSNDVRPESQSYDFEKHQEFLIENAQKSNKDKVIDAITDAKKMVLEKNIHKFIQYDNLRSDICFQSLREDKYKIDFKLRGQRKLLLTEIMALSETCFDKTIQYNVLYIGAGPGTHIAFLADGLFKHCTFHLFDDNFDGRLYRFKNIRLNKRYFGSDSDIKAYSKLPNLVLFSDIRSKNIAFKTLNSDCNNIIFADQKLQEQWVVALRPSVAYIKFRIAYSDENIDYNYLDGKIEMQPYAPNSSTETRLKIVYPGDGIDYKYKIYNNKIMENKFFYYNAVLRKSVDFGYINNVKTMCLDDLYCLYIINLYKSKINANISIDKLYRFIIENKYISRN